ncbi:MAG: hypothetical protein J0H07_17810 [Sphingobacteriales bacterium]|nr:hypothetical protein [Sphingobacteriales bacterium]
MKSKKISLETIQGKLSRNEMARIMAGSGDGQCGACSCIPCLFSDGSQGICRLSTASWKCYCASGGLC